jgi:mono/diheme cytochrome c family protein
MYRTTCCLLLILAGWCLVELPVQGAEPPVDFNREIRPLLAKKCFACHGPDDEHREAGLRLDTQAGATAELDSGSRAIVVGQSAASELVRRIRSMDDGERMPPAETGITLTDAQIALLARWVDEGASYAPHWAMVKPQRPALPAVQDTAWSEHSIDRFVLARLEAAGLAPAPRADRYALIRRASLDLRGLPPTPEEVEQFVADGEPQAYQRMVDRMLADSAFGERWARMWLDQARYADSRGYGSDPLRPNAWRYRDWVIDAFNANMPYDQFTIEQIAGDLLPEATVDQKVATAFHRNTMTNTEGGTDDEEFRVAAVKDRADTTMQVWMGITLGCAKCHNHKYEPISQREYYQFYAIFNQTADADRPDDSPALPAPTREWQSQVDAIDRQVAELRQQLESPTDALTAEQAAWEARLRTPAKWTTLKMSEMKSTGGATLKQEASGSIVVSGENPPQDTFVLTTEITGKLEALRLQTIHDAFDPHYRAGRSPTGDFRLTGISLTATPADQPAGAAQGRFVRIELPGSQKILSLAEVQVFASGENIATQGKASQSSVAFEGPAKLAIDGNTDGRYYESKSVTHNNQEDSPWWEVDLGKSQPIERIAVWNRTDGGGAIGSRLAGYKLIVLDDTRQVVWQTTPSAVPAPSSEFSPSGAVTLELTAAAADYSAPGADVASLAKTPRDPKAAWSIAGDSTQPHASIFAVKDTAAASGSRRLVIKLAFEGPEPQQVLQWFQLSVTSEAAVRERLAVPNDILAIVDSSAAERSADHEAKLAAYYRSIAPSLQPLRDQIAALEKSKPAVPTVPVMQELATDKQRTTWLMVKGNFLSKGEELKPGLPTAFHQLAVEEPIDRLALARWLVHPDNPLTARVAVNRFWAQLFGAGLVETEEDFGIQGELPSHPELLDWLAVEFQSGGWDMKSLLKLIVTSETYCQSSRVTPELVQKDPRNRLLSRGARFRLEAEMVRDQALAISGLLSRKLRGPSVFPPQPDGLWQAAFNGERTWSTSTGEDRYRRGLYTFWRRTIPYPSMTTFDAPSRETCSARRSRTNTPLQAFVTMNDPVYVEASQALARRIVREGGASASERAAFALRLCLIRPPAEEQVAALVELYESELAHYQSDAEAAAKLATDPLGPLPEGMNSAEAAAWTVVANVLLNLDGVLMRG